MAAVPDLLAAADLPGWTAAIGVLRAQLIDLLAAHGLSPEPGAANFVWVPAAPRLREQLLPHRILVRSGATFGCPDAVRIAVPTATGLEHLAQALTRIEV